jgi:hypothetical protein
MKLEDPQGFQTIHTLWTAAITVGGGIVAFFTKRLVDDVDQKADRYEVDELKKDIKAFLERQDDQHRANTTRLDQILLTLSERRDRRTTDRGKNE